MTEKKYFWLKLKEDLFSSRRIKKLRSLDKGDTLFVIYLKLQLAALRTEGILTCTGLEETIEEELALDIDEEVSLVKATIDFLLKHELAERISDKKILLPWVIENTGSETADAKRMRLTRAKQKEDCSDPAEQCDTADEKCSNNVQNSAENVRQRKSDIQSNIQSNSHNQIYPVNKKIFLAWSKERGIDESFAAGIFDRYSANNWLDNKGDPIRVWQNVVLNAWRKEKKNSAPKRAQPAAASYSEEDLIEYPYGSGQYRLRKEVEGLTDG